MDAVDRKDPDRVINALAKHFIPKKNTIYERYMFGTCSQKPGQTIDEYVAELRKFAAMCGYGQLKDEFIRDRTVLGTSDAVAQAHMIHEKKLTVNIAGRHAT